MELYWEVLLMAVLNFRFIYPSERDTVPRWVLDELLDRLHAQPEVDPPRKRFAAGGFSARATMRSTSNIGASPRRSATSKSNMKANNDKIRVAAIGDLHVTEDSVAPYRELFAEISGVADVLVLCGDLTNFGKTSEAEILADDIRDLRRSRSSEFSATTITNAASPRRSPRSFTRPE